MSHLDSTSAVLANVNQMLAAARIYLKNSDLDEEKQFYNRRIDWLMEMKNEMEEEDRKLAAKFRENLNLKLKEMPIPTWVSNQKVLKRKPSSSDESAPKRQKLDEDTNPISFTELPNHLHDMIFEKFDYKSFATFDLCSDHSHSMCKDTKLKFLFKSDLAKVENGRWNFRPMPGIGRNVLATIDELRNARLVVRSLDINDEISNDMCLFLIAQVNTTKLTCTQSFDCSQALLNQLLQTLCLEHLFVDWNNLKTDYQWDVSNVEHFFLSGAAKLTMETLLTLKPKHRLSLFDYNLTGNKLKEIIEGMMHTCGYRIDILCGHESQSISTLMEEYGNRAKLVDRTTNCWAIADEQSLIPQVVVVCKLHEVYIVNPTDFYSSFRLYAEYDD